MSPYLKINHVKAFLIRIWVIHYPIYTHVKNNYKETIILRNYEDKV